MTIPARIRERIGSPGLTPVWRIGALRSDLTNPQDQSPAVPQGGTATVSMAVETAPSRTLQIASVDRYPYVKQFGPLRKLQWGPNDPAPFINNISEVWTGYRDEAGTEYLEKMGRYFPSQMATDGVTQTLSMSSSEYALLEARDWSVVYGAAQAPRTFASVLAFVKWMRGSNVVQDDEPLYTPTTAEGWGNIGYGTALWPALVNVLQAAQLRVHVDDDDVWHLVRTVRSMGEPVATLRDGVGGTLISASGTQDVNVPNNLLVRFRWTDPDGTERTVNGSAGRANQYWSNSALEDRSEPMTKTAADAFAASRLAALQSSYRVWSVEAVSMPWIRLDDTVQVTLGGITRKGIVMRADFNLPKGTMTLTLRSVDI